jgi:anti-sigma factor RsiW
MTEPIIPEPISELDLMAYVDDQLDPERRIAVEEHLSRHPILAAQVMDDLRRRDELRLALTEAASTLSDHRLELPTQQLGRRLSLRIALHKNRRAIAASILVGVGWVAHSMFGGLGVDPASAAHILPVYADEAVEAYRTVLVEARHEVDLPGAGERERIGALAANAGTSIPLPHLPAAFAPVASHLVPCDSGNAVQMLIHGPDEELLTLFAVETDKFSIEPPHAEAVRDVNVAYWQSGWFAYVLSGTGDPKELLSLAFRLSR